MPYLRLRFGIRGPIVGYMFILTGDLAVIAAVANRYVVHKNLLLYLFLRHET
jgi:hypothetical protein